MFDSSYVCPVACHRDIAERLLVKDLSGSWFLWMGDDTATEPVDVPHDLARWIAARPEMVALDPRGMWFAISSLPVTPVSAGPGRQARNPMP
ncbi:MAG: hypothetical protein M3440_09965 [Chloroflexota bacterium]|nr:hypothetical protein [Chloroflexota bacterium]